MKTVRRLRCLCFGHAKPVTYKARPGFFYLGPSVSGWAEDVNGTVPVAES
jgi:hypothetical protein